MIRALATTLKRPVALGLMSLLIFGIAGAPFAPRNVAADTVPPTGTPATVSADPLPTVQIDGIVWKQAIHGNKVYATGRFATARPSGVAKGGAGTVTRTNLIAYDITTGLMDTSFVHSLSGTDLGGASEGRAIAVSPDGKRLYVGGSFTAVDGQARKHFAAFDLTTNKLLPGFTGTNGHVHSIAATNTQVFIGGSFSTAGGVSHTNLASYNVNGALTAGWNANTNGLVAAMVVAPAQGNLIIGGSFSQMNGKTYYSSGAVKLTTGAAVAWGSQSSSYRITLQAPAGSSPSTTGVTSLSTDGTQVYLTAFTFNPAPHPGTFEGRAAISPSNGAIIWVNNCAGDSYDSFPVGKVLYSVSHAHNCSAINGFGQQESQRALAETTYATGTNTAGTGYASGFPNYNGFPRGSLLVWFPRLTVANVSGSYQAAWSVTGNANYISLGGEFPTVEGKAQQGLVRYGLKSLAPNKIAPTAFTGYGIDVAPADSTGKSVVTMRTTGDEDNSLLTYYLYRSNGTTPIFSKQVASYFWTYTKNTWTFTDTGLTPGTKRSYKMVAKDSFGNTSPYTYSLVDDLDASIKYVGAWTNAQNRVNYDEYHHGFHYTTTNGNYATFTFTGTNFALIGEKSPERGTVAIKIDGISAGTVSAYSASHLFQQTIFQKTGLTNAKHVVTVTKVDAQYMDIDGFLVKP